MLTNKDILPSALLAIFTAVIIAVYVDKILANMAESKDWIIINDPRDIPKLIKKTMKSPRLRDNRDQQQGMGGETSETTVPTPTVIYD
ncbi:hypothetical protein J6590_013424 [Homalodisca vitripennis]|nr:hypothetical protein J6590_013424 [Homalodisca vitripennis]